MNHILYKYQITVTDCLDKKIKTHFATGFSEQEAISKIVAEYDGNEAFDNRLLNYKYPLSFMTEQMNHLTS